MDELKEKGQKTKKLIMMHKVLPLYSSEDSVDASIRGLEN